VVRAEVADGKNLGVSGPAAQTSKSAPNRIEPEGILPDDFAASREYGRVLRNPRCHAPFRDNTRVRLNEIKQREQFRPIAPVCLEEDAAQWFGCNRPSPFMLYTYRAKTDALAAVTHVNGTAGIQTVSSERNQNLYELLVAFKARTGFGVLCNTSLNFSGRGFINKVRDPSACALEHNLDGFVGEGRAYLLKVSNTYRTYLKKPNRLTGTISLSQV
jgi:hypothetical protein